MQLSQIDTGTLAAVASAIAVVASAITACVAVDRQVQAARHGALPELTLEHWWSRKLDRFPIQQRLRCGADRRARARRLHGDLCKARLQAGGWRGIVRLRRPWR
jgi:hypothetical protein